MFGIISAFFGTFFDEIAGSIGKKEVEEKKESVYTMGFLNTFWSLIIFAGIIIIKQEFIFSLSSLPTFLCRVILELLLCQAAIHAVCQADRSTFGFIRVLTIPLLLITDILLGYNISNPQIIGIALVILTLIFTFFNHGIKKQGALLTLAVSILAVGTISLYKYNITHYNSVEAEQFLMILILLIYYFIFAKKIGRENPFKLIFKPLFFTQSASSSIGTILISFAYRFAPASIILATIRSTAVFWTIVSGRFYFQEKHIVVKLVTLVLLSAGIILIII
jgi:drug/metabolite transporter (DMT)-like permease